MKSPEFPCGYCNGTGRQKLSKTLQQTYDIIVRLGQPTCAEIRSRIKRKMNQSTVFKQVKLLHQKKLVRQVDGAGHARYEALVTL